LYNSVELYQIEHVLPSIDHVRIRWTSTWTSY